MKSKLNNLQGGDNDLPDKFYENTLRWISRGDNILNLGSGSNFNFERVVSSNKKDINFTSIDIIPAIKPNYVNEFKIGNVEKILPIKHKFDIVTFFEVIEHIDNTDGLMRNCYKNLKKDGLLIFSFPNLASIYSRVELLLGLQPHILEISNERANFGTGIFGRVNNATNEPIHHIRGITHKAMREFVEYHGFKILHMLGYEYRLGNIFKFFPRLAPVNIFVAKKC